MKITNYTKAINYLEGFIGKVIFRINKEFLKKHDPLERMRVLLNLLGNPQEKFESVLVGGTSGKGSTSYLISHILTTSGFKTGFTLSPHLQKVNERLQINGRQISDFEFTKMVASMIRIIETMKKMEVGMPSYFEILVAMAFKYFADQKVDIAVVEVGMGGEFDGTNTLSPLIAILTNVGLDHTNILGKTIEKIARTKAGIIKGLRIKDKGLIHHSSFIINHLSVVSGVKQPSVIKIIEKKCEDTGSKLNLLWRDFGYKIKKESVSGTEFDFISHEETLENINLSLLGQYQAENASLSIKTILELRKLGFAVSDKAIRKALKTAFFPGRFEVIKAGPVASLPPASAPSSGSVRAVGSPSSGATRSNYTLILDGAHNPTKMKEFLKSLKKLYPRERKVFIVGFKFDKEIKKMLKQIIKVADEIIVTEFKAKTDMNLHASTSAENLKTQIAKLKSGTKVMVEKDSKKALDKALAIQQYNNSTIIIVTGSLYLVGEIRTSLF